MKKSRYLWLLLALMMSMVTRAQGILGTVTDENGEPIIGASVVEKGNPQNGSITDFDGNFNVKVSEGTTITISYIGYVTQELRATRGMKVVLKEDAQTLQDKDNHIIFRRNNIKLLAPIVCPILVQDAIPLLLQILRSHILAPMSQIIMRSHNSMFATQRYRFFLSSPNKPASFFFQFLQCPTLLPSCLMLLLSCPTLLRPVSILPIKPIKPIKPINKESPSIFRLKGFL